MALLNELQVGRYNGILHKLLDMKEGAPSPQLAGDIQPVLVLEADRPEWKYLGGEYLCLGYGRVSATNIPHAHLQNDQGAGVLVVLEKFVVSCSAAGEIFGGHRDGLVGGGSQAFAEYTFRDSRLSRAADVTAATVVTYDNAASQLTVPNVYARVLANTPYTFDIPVVLQPGDGFLVRGPTGATFGVTFVWRERYLEPSELR